MTDQMMEWKLSFVDLGKGRSRRYRLVQRTMPLSDGKCEFTAYFGEIGTQLKQNYRMTMADAEAKVKRKINNDGYILLTRGAAIRREVRNVDMHEQVRGLMKEIIRVAFSQATGTLSVDISDLHLGAVEQAKQILEGIRQCGDDKLARATLVSAYYGIIPTNIPTTARKRDEILAQFSVNGEFDRLNQIETILLTQEAQDATDMVGVQYQMLGAQIDWIDPLTKEFSAIDAGIRTTSEGFCLDELFSVKIPQERDVFESQQMKLGRKVARLYHGTNMANYQHILRTGLVIMPQATNGSRFGRGLYFADCVDKSLNYAAGSKYLFIADVAVGNQYVTPGTTSGPQNGYDSVHGTMSHGGFDEFVVYSEMQQSIKYIARIKRKVIIKNA